MMKSLVEMQLKSASLINKYHSLVLKLPGTNRNIVEMTDELRNIK